MEINFYDKNNFLKFVLSFRLLVILLMSPLLSRLGDGFNWRSAFIMVWSEMRGIPNINMALLLAYSEFPLASERERLQVKKDIFFIWIFYKKLLLCTKICFCIEVAQPHLNCGSELAMMARLGRGGTTGNFPLHHSSLETPKFLHHTRKYRFIIKVKGIRTYKSFKIVPNTEYTLNVFIFIYS